MWRALSSRQQPVALKLLLADPGNRPDLLLRFRSEGQLLARLGGRHHLIAGLEVVDRPPCLVLELATGGTLADRLRSDPRVPWPEVLAVATQLAEALDWLHRNEVIHRDVKPSNLVRLAGGEWRLIDLGVAAAGRPPRGLPIEWIEEAVATAGYAAPELLRDPAAAAPAVDVYSLGAVLYEMVTGKLPVEMLPGEEDEGYRVRAQTGPRPGPISVAHLSRSRIEAILRAVDPDPGVRFSSPRELVAGLEAG